MAPKDDAAASAVLQYFLHQNRPYSAQVKHYKHTDIFLENDMKHSPPGAGPPCSKRALCIYLT